MKRLSAGPDFLSRAVFEDWKSRLRPESHEMWFDHWVTITAGRPADNVGFAQRIYPAAPFSSGRAGPVYPSAGYSDGRMTKPRWSRFPNLWVPDFEQVPPAWRAAQREWPN